MTGAEILDRLFKDDVQLIAKGQKLAIKAPEGYLTPERLEQIKKYKKEIIAHLTEKPAFVWRVKVGAKTISIIDPERSTYKNMRKECRARFGDRVGEIALYFGQDRVNQRPVGGTHGSP